MMNEKIESQIRKHLDTAYVRLVNGSTMTQRMEVDPKSGEITLSEFADVDSYTMGLKSIFFQEPNSFDPFFDMDAWEFSNSETISECRGTVHFGVGRAATPSEIEEFELDATKNVRVIPKVEFWESLDNEEDIQDIVDDIMRQYNEIMEEESMRDEILKEEFMRDENMKEESMRDEILKEEFRGKIMKEEFMRDDQY